MDRLMANYSIDNIDFYLAHTHEIHINALYNTNKHQKIIINKIKMSPINAAII